MAAAVSAFGLDYSSARPSHAAMKTAGVKFVCRYVGSQDRTSSRDAKWLGPAEAKSLHADEFDVVAVFETKANRADGGRDAGLADAHTAVAELAYCGLPAGLPVYFAVDFDTTVGPLITAYFRAVAEVIGLKRTGAYGGYKVIKALFDARLITYGMQTYAWSAGKWDSRNHIEQYSNNRSVGGASVDFDRAMKTDFGQWPAKPVPAPVPKPPSWPGRYLKYTKPLMHGSDVRWVQQRLNAHGAKPAVKVDGEYGLKTRDAVGKFQTKQRIGYDHVVGPQTWNALAK
jgi:glycoside hydrolase-like protein/putative peptidoglycan binding protein